MTVPVMASGYVELSCTSKVGCWAGVTVSVNPATERVDGAGTVTVRLNALLVEPPELSETPNVKLEVPPTAGVPLRTPAALNARPEGKVPEATDQVYGEIPPVTASVCE